jgi:ribonucleotide reductase beta subunit family protein with ferritin-like domain
MEQSIKPMIETPTKSYVIRYPQAVDAAVQQQNVFWAAEKMGVESDEQDFRTKLTDGEMEAVLLLQAILTQYELLIGGEEMWGGKIANMFPRPEIGRMCSEFSHAELCSHAPFYKIGNVVLRRDTDEFYNSWEDNPVLAAHISYINKVASSDNPLKVTAALCFLEGVVLFSAFAFFKSFNTGGFNLIPHFVSGIDASAKDENFHSMGSAWLYNTCKSERLELGLLTVEDEAELSNIIEELISNTISHEFAIIDMLFEHGKIRTITKQDMKDFILDRIDVVCSYLNHKSNRGVNSRKVITNWFYDNLSKFKYADFFAATQVQYVKNWNKSKLVFNEGV